MPPPKVTTAQKQAQVPIAYKSAHTAPRFNLAEEPWIPALDALRYPRRVSLRELLTESQNILDIAESEPLARAALRRWLTALTIRLVQLSGSGKDWINWTNRLDANSGFTKAEVTALLDDQADHLWLYHPRTPFLQDTRFLDGRPFNLSWQTTSDELVPNAPGDDSRAWAVKPGDPHYRAGMDEPTAAVALVRRWFYGLNGNGGGGDMGAAFPNGTADAPITHLFRISPVSLFSTLLRNITEQAMAEGATPVTGPAWMDAARPRQHGDGLYTYTTTASSCLLLGPDPSGRVGDVLRGSIDDPPGSKPQRKAAKDAARGSDPHRIRRPDSAKGKPQSDVRVPATDPPLKRLSTLRRGVVAGQTVAGMGVVNNSQLWLANSAGRHDETLELLLAGIAGSATSPQWAATAVAHLPALHLDPQWAQSEDLDILLEAGFGDHGVYRTIHQGVSRVFRETDRKRPVGTALADQARWIWLAKAEDIAGLALRGDLDDLEAVSQFWRAAADSAQTALVPYATSTAYAGNIVQAVANLNRRAIPQKEPR